MNYNFLKIQFQKIWIILILFSILTILLTTGTVIGNSTFSSWTVYTKNVETSGNAGIDMAFGAIIIASNSLVSFILIILLINILLNKEISQGYIGSWLSLPISRNNIYFTKFLTISFSLLIYQLISFSSQEILYKLTMKDFTNKIALYLVILNITLYLVSILFLSFCLFLSTAINKRSISLTITSILAAIFFISYLLNSVGPVNKGSWVYNLQYISITSLCQQRLTYDTNKPIIENINNDSYAVYYQSLINYSNLWWKVVTPAIISPLFIYSSSIIFKSKNFML